VKFYYAPHTCALASHIALEEAGAEYELVRVDFAANEQRAPAYMSINPKGRVPSLLTPRGILTETPAILMFVGPWVMGERYTIADPYLFTLAQWLELDGVDPKRLPKISDHRARMSQRATVRKAIAAETSS